MGSVKAILDLEALAEVRERIPFEQARLEELAIHCDCVHRELSAHGLTAQREAVPERTIHGPSLAHRVEGGCFVRIVQNIVQGVD